jgi:hypothetical protein
MEYTTNFVGYHESDLIRRVNNSMYPTWIPTRPRRLQRIIWIFVREPLADYLLEKNPSAGAKIRVEAEGKG